GATYTNTAVSLLSAATVSDVDNQTLASATVAISSGFFTGDVLAFTNTSSTTYGNITAIYNNAGVLTLTSAGATATLAQWQAALDAVRYSSTSINPTNFGNDPSRTISWVINDGTLNNSTIPTTTLNITATILTIPAGQTLTLSGDTLTNPLIVDNGTILVQ